LDRANRATSTRLSSILFLNKSTNDLPLGTERLNWNIEKLIELEVGIEKADMKYKYEILRNCKNIIDKYEKNKT
jgi:hypothetical protein